MQGSSGSGVGREPYKSLCPCVSFVTNFEACDWSTQISLVIFFWISLIRIRVLSDHLPVSGKYFAKK